jgi:hypothetical protein
MADNVRIVGQVLDTNRVNRYDIQDEQLLLPIIQQETFGRLEDYVEYFVFDLGGNVLNSNYNYSAYKLPSNYAYSQSFLPTLEINPVQDIEDLGYESGEVTSRYNFFRKVSGEPFSNQLFISQISSDRTELRISSTELNDIDLIDIASKFAEKQAAVPYYYYLLLNFGNNNQVVAVNIISEVNAAGEASLLIKLYESLPANILLKDTFWIVEEIINPYIYDISLNKLITPLPQPYLKGPNFDLDLEFKNVVPTQYSNLTQLLTSFTGSSYQATLNSLTNQEINLNIDYSILNNFIHYSSAESRLRNFMYKIGEIEGYQYEINTFSPLTSSNVSLINQVNRASSSLNSIIAGFDGFESYLYYNSSSLTSSIVEYTLETGSYLTYNIAPYPKSSSTQPYILFASSSTPVTTWYSTALNIAEAYDIFNKDILIDTIPSYILEDEDNYLPYITFVNMIGQYFDNIWVYIDRMTDVWDNNNNLNEGISQDLVYDWLKSFGMKLYNSQGNQSLLDYNRGLYSGSTEFSNPNCKTVVFTRTIDDPPGSPSVINYVDCFEVSQSVSVFFGQPVTRDVISYIIPARTSANIVGPAYVGDYSPSSSFLNNIPRKDLVLDTYKRLYHNLPYLFKGKGAHGGLQGLINLFGITGSILPIKEYGGTNDYQDLKGYNSSKITLGSNNITGSILSPIKRFETTTTSSRDIKSQDLHFVDVSFSPQTQIDAEVSASITAVDPNWVIDEYIGYPEALYLDTYPSLSFQRDYWFEQTFTHPNEGFDYGGFIRLIQFFDNSLFKMINDFVPARGNTWTGVSIKSPVLERPKVPEARPLFTNFPDLEGQITGAAILPVYDPYYFELAGNKESYYTGNITGSFIDTYAYFEENNINPYLVNNTVGYIPPGFVSGNTDFILNYDAPYYENFFENSDFNVLQNNVSSSLISRKREKLVPILTSDDLGRVFYSYSILEPVELQDSYLSLTSYTNSRYNGSQLYGQFFNIWTLGDNSYGVSPVINYNVKKIGLFTEIVDGFTPYLSNIKLKYLVNEQGNTTELNLRNRNWEEVQNTFKTGETLNVSLFNNQQYSDQVQTDGNKIIHESGYSYYPVFYANGNEADADTTIASFTSNTNNYGSLADSFFNIVPEEGYFAFRPGPFTPVPGVPIFNSSSYTGVGNPYEVWDFFNYSGAGDILGAYYFPGIGPNQVDSNGMRLTSSYYEIPFDGVFTFSYNFAITLYGDPGCQLTASFQPWLSSSVNNTYEPISSATRSYSDILNSEVYIARVLSNTYANDPNVFLEYLDEAIDLYNGYTLKIFYDARFSCYQTPQETTTIIGNQIFYKYRIYKAYSSPPFQEDLGFVWLNTNNPPLNWRDNQYTKYADLAQCTTNEGITLIFNSLFQIDASPSSTYFPGDRIVFRLFLTSNPAGNGVSEINSANINGDPYLKVTPSQNVLQASPVNICVNQDLNSFYLNSQLSSFFSNDYTFTPLNPLTSASFASLYQNYGPILYPFDLIEGDKIIFQIIDDNGPYLEYTVENTYFNASDGQRYINIKEDISGYFGNLECDVFYKMVFLKRIKDETNIIINLQKPSGQTSYGFIIPSNITQAVLDNIDEINRNIKQQLINTTN